MEKLNLSASSLSELEEAHKKQLNKKSVNYPYKILSIILYNKYNSLTKVSEMLLLDRNTVKNYVNKYLSGGIPGLMSDNYVAYEGKLSPAAIEELSSHLEESSYMTTKEIIEYVKNTYDEEYSTSGITALLHRMGFTYKYLKSIPGKADEKAQEDFIKKYKSVKKKMSPEDGMYFIDATHPTHNSIPYRAWVKKGVDKPLNSTVSRQRLNIHGALNIDNFSVTTRYEHTLDKNTAIEILFDLRAKQPKGKIYIVLDNAKYYQNDDFQKYAKELGIHLLYLPPYCPNLNLIERLWLFFLKKQIYNKYYKTFDDFKNSAKSFFKSIGKHKAELETLLTENFNILSLKNA